MTTPSCYTKDQLKAYKSLDAYKYVVDGWVSNIQLFHLKGRITGKVVCVVLGDVKHSQRLSVSSLHPHRNEEYGKMILCDSSNCAIQWFHIDCLKLAEVPKGKWYCPVCTKGKRRKRQSKK